jgi:hypothetical protein
MRKNNATTSQDLTTFKKLSNLLFIATPSVFFLFLRRYVRETSKVSLTCFALIMLALLLCQCQEVKKGCLDIRATNFDATADKPCVDNCCTYPNMVITATYNADSEQFKADKFYKLSTGDSIKIIDIQFYISDVQLVNAANKSFTVIDDAVLYWQKDTVRTRNNFTLAGRNNGFSFKLGKFNTIDKFTKLRFKLGLTDTLNKTDPTKMPTGHPLSIQRDSVLYNKATKSYVFNRIVIAKGQRLGDTLSLNITSLKDIEITTNITNKEGFDVNIPLIINYLAFFKGVNFASSENSIKEKIVSNYVNVFQ